MVIGNFRGYIEVTGNLIYDYCCMNSILLGFIIFWTSHTGEATAPLLFEVFEGWDIVSKMREITTDNVADLFSGTSIFREKWIVWNN